MPIISLQVSDELLERFEDVRNKSGFDSKSEALRQAITDFIESSDEFDKLEGYKIMTLNLVYPFKDTIIDEVSELYSQFQQIIKTITDWRIAEKKIEVLITVGEIGLIKDLYLKLSNIKDLVCSIHEVIIE